MDNTRNTQSSARGGNAEFLEFLSREAERLRLSLAESQRALEAAEEELRHTRFVLTRYREEIAKYEERANTIPDSKKAYVQSRALQHMVLENLQNELSRERQRNLELCRAIQQRSVSVTATRQPATVQSFSSKVLRARELRKMRELQLAVTHAERERDLVRSAVARRDRARAIRQKQFRRSLDPRAPAVALQAQSLREELRQEKMLLFQAMVENAASRREEEAARRVEEELEHRVRLLRKETQLHRAGAPFQRPLAGGVY